MFIKKKKNFSLKQNTKRNTFIGVKITLKYGHFIAKNYVSFVLLPVCFNNVLAFLLLYKILHRLWSHACHIKILFRMILYLPKSCKYNTENLM